MADTGAHKLKDLKITNVDFVDEGANKRADILITKRKESGGLKGAWKAVRKALGLDAAERVKKAAVDFNTAIARADIDQIRGEIWKFTDAINSSLQSILTDEDTADDDRLSLMEESVDQFAEAIKQAAGKWVCCQLSNISTKTEEPEAVNEAYPKGDQIDMRIDKSKMTEEEREVYEALIRKYAAEDPAEPEVTKAAKPAPKKPSAKAGTVDPEGNQDEEDDDDDTEKCTGRTRKSDQEKCSTKKSADPIVKSLMAEIESLKKYKEENEQKELEGIAKKYEPLGITAADLVPTLKNLKAMGGEAYDQYIHTLDASLNTQAQSGMFEEIGKSSHGMTAPAHGSAAEAKIDGIAKSMCEKDPSLSYNIAKARAWAQNPDLYEQYENETGR